MKVELFNDSVTVYLETQDESKKLIEFLADRYKRKKIRENIVYTNRLAIESKTNMFMSFDDDVWVRNFPYFYTNGEENIIEVDEKNRKVVIILKETICEYIVEKLWTRDILDLGETFFDNISDGKKILIKNLKIVKKRYLETDKDNYEISECFLKNIIKIEKNVGVNNENL